MSRINRTQVLVFGLVVLVVFLVGLSLLPMLFGGYWGMGPGMMGRGGMMGGWWSGCAGAGRFGGGGLIFTLLGLLIPIGLLGLLIMGGVWLVRNVGRAIAPPVPAQTCPGCGQPTGVGWRNCPYCGAEL